MYSAYYQMYQMTHGKGIAIGYLSRSYAEHPVFPCLIPDRVEMIDILLDGEPVQCYQNTLIDLAQNNYRYVVYHKPQSIYKEYTPGSWGEQRAGEFIDRFFGEQLPLVDDDLVRVYEVPGIDQQEVETMMRPGENWYNVEVVGDAHWRWARSPAILDITSDTSQEACLEITPLYIHDSAATGYFGNQGTLTVSDSKGLSETIEIRPEVKSRVSLNIVAGENNISLSLEAGNFQPSRIGSADTRWLSFATRKIDLQTGSSCDYEIETG
jgi:hypothetical protein